MSRVLLAFYNGIYDEQNPRKIPCWYDGLVNGLEKCGHEVFLWQLSEFGSLNTFFSEADKMSIKAFEPELCLSFNNVLPDVTNVANCPVVTIIVDSAKYLSNVDLLKNRIVGTFQEADISYLVENYQCSKKKHIFM